MPTLIPHNDFRYWVKTEYPNIYDDSKSNYELLFELRSYYTKVNRTITNEVANINRHLIDKNSYFSAFINWFATILETDPTLDDKIQTALNDGTITSMSESINTFDSLLFKNIL